MPCTPKLLPVIQRSIRSIYRGANSMTSVSRVKMIRVTTIRVLAFGVLVLTPTSWAQRPPILEQIAKTYGLDSFGQIESIRYTWNGEIPGVFKLAHVWQW